MPAYEYFCDKCDEYIYSLQVKVEDRDKQVCSECGSKVHRQIPLPSFHLKGGGWSKDGYATLVGDSPEFKTMKEDAIAQKRANDKAGGR